MRETSAIICSLLLITLHLSSLLPVADSRKPPSPGKNTSSGLSHSQDGSSFKQGGLGSGGKDMETLDSSGRGLMGRIGSTPPSCVHRCRGCSPCNAIQIPAITDRTMVEYANYEPEGWKCKCGPHFFDP